MQKSFAGAIRYQQPGIFVDICRMSNAMQARWTMEERVMEKVLIPYTPARRQGGQEIFHSL
ncbi:MAG: hypothetical protein B6D35_05790 [Candidatus Brocadia sp. UTAMX2]|nr:MAG: hypothetical protein B6D35_05790 [Candidatus Brocadia sp. UTAMX2]